MKRGTRTFCRVYPRRYRQQRGHEILATLLDAADNEEGRARRAEVASVVAHGMRMRLGLAPDQLFGRIAQLAALPSLVMAGGYAALLLAFGEVLPVVTRSPIALRFGPFWTIGPVVYVTWILGGATAFLWPRLTRTCGVACLGITVASIPVGDVLLARPRLLALVPLMGLGLVAVVGPLSAAKPNRGSALGASAFTVAFLSWVALPPGGVGRDFPTFYWSGLRHLQADMQYVAMVGIVCIWLLRMTHRLEIAGAIAMLLAPWLLVSVIYPYGEAPSRVVSGGVLGVLVAWLVVERALEPRNPSKPEMGTV